MRSGTRGGGRGVFHAPPTGPCILRPRCGRQVGAPGEGPLEAREGLPLIAEDLEYLLQLREDQEVLDLAGRIEELQAGSLLRGALVACDQLSDAGAVHVGHPSHVQEDALAALLQEGIDRLAQLDVPVSDRDLTGEVHDRDFSVMPDVRLHLLLRLIGWLVLPACSSCFPSRTSVPLPRRFWKATLATKS